MKTQNLFEGALNTHDPWDIKSVEFSQEKHRLDIYIDFKTSTFPKLIQKQ